MSDMQETDTQELAGEIKNLRDDFGRIGRVLEEFVRSRGAAAAAGAGRTAERAWEEVSKTAESAAQTIEENPLATLAGAFGIGLLLGMLFSGRRN